jgi:AraC-like DNA-binding protein/mannose-6-phosphate isomerase-like protein (cupin superfamily)
MKDCQGTTSRTFRYHQHREHGSSGFMAMADDRSFPIQQGGEVWAPGKWIIPWHSHAGWELHFQVKGESLWEIGAEQVEVSENGAYLIRNSTRHRLLNFRPGGVHYYWTVLSPSVVPAEMRTAACWRRPYTIVRQAYPLLHPLQGIVREISLLESWQREVCGWYAAILCATFTRMTQSLHPEQPLRRHPSVERARHLFAGRMEYPWRLDELARLVGVSKQHLIALSRRQYGQTPMKMLQQMRLDEARRQLRETDKQIIAIAIELGFASSQHLARSCRAAFGKTPTQMRRGD